MPLASSTKSPQILGILSDVDGVLTDGQLLYDSAGRESKNFHVRDGLGIKLWMAAGFKFGLITARHSEMVARRAAELGIFDVVQNAADKWNVAESILAVWEISAANVAYVGDDLPDLAVMRQVGLAVAPADAASDVLAAADWVLKASGGQGVVRELIERLMRASGDWQPDSTASRIGFPS